MARNDWPNCTLLPGLHLHAGNYHRTSDFGENAALRDCFGLVVVFIEALSIDFRKCHATTGLHFQGEPMAPHALTDLNDPSGYYPATAHKVWSQNLGRHRSIKPTTTEPVPDLKIPFGNLGFGRKSPKNVWNLSSDEIAEIEKNARDFIGTRKRCITTYTICDSDQASIYRSAPLIKQRSLSQVPWYPS